MSRGFEHTVFRRTSTGWLALRMLWESELARGVGPTRAAAAADMIAHMIPRIAATAFDSRIEKNAAGEVRRNAVTSAGLLSVSESRDKA